MQPPSSPPSSSSKPYARSSPAALRNRGAIASRAEGGLKDFLFTAGDLRVSSSFKLGKHGKVEAWMSQQDVELSRMRENYVEFEFSADGEGEYRCWILAGGCCQEVLTFFVQGTDLLGPNPENPKEKIAIEPGGGSGIQVKSTYFGFKKTHAQHTGPKNPTVSFLAQYRCQYRTTVSSRCRATLGR